MSSLYLFKIDVKRVILEHLKSQNEREIKITMQEQIAM